MSDATRSSYMHVFQALADVYTLRCIAKRYAYKPAVQLITVYMRTHCFIAAFTLRQMQTTTWLMLSATLSAAGRLLLLLLVTLLTPTVAAATVVLLLVQRWVAGSQQQQHHLTMLS
jgi:hypothetical protein